MAILVTRPSPDGETLVEVLQQRGLQAHHFPLITRSAGRELDNFPHLLDSLQKGDFLFAVSESAISYADSFLQKNKLSWPAELHYCAIGKRTARIMAQASHQKVHFPTTRETSEALLKLPILHTIQNKQILILRGNGGRNFLAEQLQKRGAIVSFCECYQRLPIQYEKKQIIALWQSRDIDTLVITSAEMLQQLYLLTPKSYRMELLQCHLVTVSTRIAALAKKIGWTQLHLANNADNPSILTTLYQLKLGMCHDE